MIIFPAIDLKEKKAVRLSKGDMKSAKIYSNEPSELAKKFADMGATWLHVVDLDGAFAGASRNFDVVEKIVRSTNLRVEIGGGIRSEESVRAYFDAGVSRVILGSVALKNPEFVKQIAKKYAVAVGIDALNGKVAVEGWAEVSEVSATQLAKAYADAGVEAVIATDISKDGMLSGVNFEFTKSIAEASGLFTVASGGVSCIADLVAARTAGVDGIIVGKAYYEGLVDLAEAFLTENGERRTDSVILQNRQTKFL